VDTDPSPLGNAFLKPPRCFHDAANICDVVEQYAEFIATQTARGIDSLPMTNARPQYAANTLEHCITQLMPERIIDGLEVRNVGLDRIVAGVFDRADADRPKQRLASDRNARVRIGVSGPEPRPIARRRSTPYSSSPWYASVTPSR
jgi:hypothetical protein